MTFRPWPRPCPACGGSGVQRGKDGMLHRCPACGGLGHWGPSLIWCGK